LPLIAQKGGLLALELGPFWLRKVIQREDDDIQADIELQYGIAVAMT
jgi:hypothetical protein